MMNAPEELLFKETMVTPFVKGIIISTCLLCKLLFSDTRYIVEFRKLSQVLSWEERRIKKFVNQYCQNRQRGGVCVFVSACG